MELKEIATISQMICLGTMLLGNSIVDLRKREISPALCYITVGIGLLVRILTSLGMYTDIKMELLSVLIGMIPGICMLICSLLTKGKIGFGDGILLVCMGALAGAIRLLVIILLAGVFTAITGLTGMIIKKWDKSKRLPFVPFIAMASSLYLAWECIASSRV